MKTNWEIVRKVRIAAAALVFLAMAASFSGFAIVAAALAPQIEFAPALLRLIAAFSLGALVTVAVIVVLTWLFGRFYCACLCPLGICQDIVGGLQHRDSHSEKDHAVLRYVIAGVVFGMLAGGWTFGFTLLDPYSVFGRAVGSRAALFGLIPLAAVALLAVWKKRIFCTAVCPVGTLLGLFSRFGLFRIRFTDKCVKCGQCVKTCPAGCIDPEAGSVDNERCVRCMNCLAACRVSGLEFAFAFRKGAAAPAQPDGSRREFLVRGGVLLAGLAAGFAAAKSGAVKAVVKVLSGAKRVFLPPGAGDMARFARKCTACQLCTANCPSKAIVPAPGGDGPVRLDLSAAPCWYDCKRCSIVCPTGAIPPMTLKEKQHIRIGVVKFSAEKCFVCSSGRPCGKCAEVCQAKAIRLKGSPGVPVVDTRLCVGCGACQEACPANPKALVVHPVAKQKRLPDSVPELPTPKPEILPPGAGDAERFVENCAGCGLCVRNCAGKVIKPIPNGNGTVHVDLSQGACKYDCTKCSSVCPTGAIRKLTLKEKQHTKIAEAAFDAKLCLACHGDEPCGKCADACPAGAIRPVGPRRVPRLNRKLCIGCGACQAACPAAPRAMTVRPIEKQSSIS